MKKLLVLTIFCIFLFGCSRVYTTKNLVLLPTAYGELYNKSDTGFQTIDLVTPNTYVVINKTSVSILNNMNFSRGTLIIVYPGVYRATSSTAITSLASEFGIKIFVNEVGQNNCYMHFHTVVGNPIGISTSCILTLAKNDIISIRIDDHSNPVQDPTIYFLNLNLVKIG